MTITPHILVGASLATTTNSATVAFLLGLVSHIILDMIPHLDLGTFKSVNTKEGDPWPAWVYITAVSEFIIIGLIFYFLFHSRSDFTLMLWGAFGALIIDIVDNNPLTFIHQWHGYKQLHWLHEAIHYNLPRDKWYWGALTSIIITGGSLWFLLKF